MAAVTIQSDDRPVGVKPAPVPARRFHNVLTSFVLAQLMHLHRESEAAFELGAIGRDVSLRLGGTASLRAGLAVYEISSELEWRSQ